MNDRPKPPEECPAESIWRDFDSGNLAPSEVDRLVDHVATCETCRELWFNDSTVVSRAEQTSETMLAFAAEPELVDVQRRLHKHSPELSAELSAALDEEVESGELGRFTLPERIDAYQIGELIGRGGMGWVYLAEHVNLKNRVALKILPPGRDRSPSAVREFYGEMEVLGKLHHPQIVQALHAGESNGLHFLAMEYVAGVDVGRLCSAIGPLRLADACEIVRQAAIALEVAWKLGVVHRDVKPANLMVSYGGRVKLLDLGLAAMRAASDAEAPPVAGTADYMAPEQWTGGAVDVRADLYSLGCTLYRMLTGEPPYAAAVTLRAKRNAHCGEGTPDVRSLRPDAPEGAARVVRKLLAKHADDRFDSPADVREAISKFCTGANLAELVAAVRPPEGDELSDSESMEAELAGVSRGRGWRRWTALTATFAAGVALAVTIIVRTNRGTLELVVDQPNAEIVVDKAAMESGEAGIPVSIRLPSGNHRIVVSKEGFRSSDRSVHVGRGEQAALSVELIRKPIDLTPAETLQFGDAMIEALATDGRRLLTGAEDGTVREYDIVSGELTTLHTHDDKVQAVAYSPDGRRAASSSAAGDAAVWDAESHAEIRRLPTEAQGGLHLEFDAAGEQLLTCGYDPVVRVWDLAGEQPPREVHGHLSWVRDIRWLSGGRLLSGGNDAAMIAWAPSENSWRMDALMLGHQAPVSSLDTAFDDRIAVSGGWDGDVRVWDLRTGFTIASLLGHRGPVRHVQIVGDGAAIASFSEDGEARLWGTRGDLLASMFAEAPLYQGVVLASGDIWATSDEGRVFHWRLPNGFLTSLPAVALDKLVPSPPVVDRARMIAERQTDRGRLNAVALSPDGKTIFAAGEAGAIFVLRDGNVSRVIDENALAILDVAALSDGRLVTSDAAGRVVARDLIDESQVALREGGAWIGELVSLRDGELAAAGFDGTLDRWAESQRISTPLYVGDGSLRWHAADALYQDGDLRMFVGGTDSSLYATSPSGGTGFLRYSEPFARMTISSIDVSPDGFACAVADWGGRVIVYRVTDGEILFDGSCGPDPITVVRFLDQRRWIAGDSTGRLHLGRADSGAQVDFWQGHTGAVRDAAVGPDSFYTVGDDAAIRTWRPNTAPDAMP